MPFINCPKAKGRARRICLIACALAVLSKGVPVIVGNGVGAALGYVVDRTLP